MSNIETPPIEFPILATLRAEGPDPVLANKLTTFGRFVGTWSLVVRFYDDTGVCVYQEPGEWSFAWILDGRAIQDVLTYPNPDRAGPSRGIGTSLRIYDQRTDEWTVIWLGAVTGITVTLAGRAVGDEIHLHGPDPDGTLNRWNFTDVTAEKFRWTGLESTDGGATWRLRQEMTAIRAR